MIRTFRDKYFFSQILKDVVTLWWDPQSRAAIVTMDEDDGLSVVSTNKRRLLLLSK